MSMAELFHPDDLKYIEENDVDRSEIKIQCCKGCSAKTVLFKDGYTKEANKIRWVDNTGTRCYYSYCKECTRGRDRESKRARRKREKSSSMS